MKTLILCLAMIVQVQKFSKDEVTQELITGIESGTSAMYAENIEMIPQIVSDEVYDSLGGKEDISDIFPPIFDRHPDKPDEIKQPEKPDTAESPDDFGWWKPGKLLKDIQNALSTVIWMVPIAVGIIITLFILGVVLYAASFFSASVGTFISTIKNFLSKD